MRELTETERQARDAKRGIAEAVIGERFDLLADLATALGLPTPGLIVATPVDYLHAIDAFIATQEIETADDRTWATARLSVFLGELFVVRYRGLWFLNEIPDSRYFLRVVVGRFGGIRNRGAMFDPFDAAEEFLLEPVPRRLESFVAMIDHELQSA